MVQRADPVGRHEGNETTETIGYERAVELSLFLPRLPEFPGFQG